MKYLSSFAVIVFLSLALACSGGSGGSPTAPGPPSVPALESESFGLLNSSRAENNVDPQLVLEEILSEVARDHSRNMRDRGFFAHEDQLGNRVGERLTAAGIQFRTASENLGFVTNADNPALWIHNELMGSAEHRPNILDPDVQFAGVGIAVQGDTVWVTQVFISR